MCCVDELFAGTAGILGLKVVMLDVVEINQQLL
jgi:hypothetical protein